ncbi:hypothetical protein [Aquimarina longa]|uniref:hypothetical protein n=1 Tax=Aquimarina longa TaxID=1080221 RepID=UPI0011E050E9|nr:hypothetical protein [Aquimarina longa]
MKLAVYTSIIGMSLLSCKQNTTNGQNDTDQNNIKQNIMVSQDYPLKYTQKQDVKSILSYLQTKFYKTPSDSIFRNVIAEKFKIDIDTAFYMPSSISYLKEKYEEVGLAPFLNKSDSPILYARAYRTNKFICPLIEDSIEGFFIDGKSFEDYPRERKEILYHFNNWMFHDNKASFAYLKAKKPYTFMHMIHDYAYTGNDEYTKFILKSIGEGRHAQENVDEMAMGWVAKKKRYGVRKNVVEKIVELQPSLVFNIGMIVSDFEGYTVKSKERNQFYTYETKEQKLEDFSYLMNVLVDQGMVGILDELYNEDPMVLGLLKKHDFYGYKDLKNYSLKRYGQTPYDEEHPKPVYDMAVINDPDGYTNVRDKSGEIIFKIMDGEEFMVSKSDKKIIGEFYKEGWWFVRFKGKEGWIHNSRVKIIK